MIISLGGVKGPLESGYRRLVSTDHDSVRFVLQFLICRTIDLLKRTWYTVKMGLLSEGTPLTWKEVQKYCEHVRQHAIIQFINQYNRLKDRQNDCLKFGDEIEYILIKFDDENKTAK